MDTPTRQHPERGQVYLASVPFAAKKTALKAVAHSDQPHRMDELDAGFTAEIQFKLRPVLVV